MFKESDFLGFSGGNEFNLLRFYKPWHNIFNLSLQQCYSSLDVIKLRIERRQFN